MRSAAKERRMRKKRAKEQNAKTSGSRYLQGNQEMRQYGNSPFRIQSHWTGSAVTVSEPGDSDPGFPTRKSGSSGRIKVIPLLPSAPACAGIRSRHAWNEGTRVGRLKAPIGIRLRGTSRSFLKPRRGGPLEKRLRTREFQYAKYLLHFGRSFRSIQAMNAHA